MPQSIIEHLPALLQNTRRREELSVKFDEDVDEYTIPKAPVLKVHEVTGFHDGDAVTFNEGADYVLSETDEGTYDTIDWDTSGESPDDGTDFVIDATFETIINRYTSAHDDELSDLGDAVDAVIESRDIDRADGDDLDELGALFGELGRRRGRDDQDYRIYLKSVVQSFNGRGSRSGLKFAIASAIGTDPENIEITERFSELEYDIQILNVDTPFISSAVNDLAELADPSVVRLGEAIIVFDVGGIEVGGGDSEIVEDEVGLGGGTLTLDGNSQLG